MKCAIVKVYFCGKQRCRHVISAERLLYSEGSRNIFNVQNNVITHDNFVELSIVLLLGKCPVFFTMLSSKYILPSGHPGLDS